MGLVYPTFSDTDDEQPSKATTVQGTNGRTAAVPHSSAAHPVDNTTNQMATRTTDNTTRPLRRRWVMEITAGYNAEAGIVQVAPPQALSSGRSQHNADQRPQQGNENNRRRALQSVRGESNSGRDSLVDNSQAANAGQSRDARLAQLGNMVSVLEMRLLNLAQTVQALRRHTAEQTRVIQGLRGELPGSTAADVGGPVQPAQGNAGAQSRHDFTD